MSGHDCPRIGISWSVSQSIRLQHNLAVEILSPAAACLALGFTPHLAVITATAHAFSDRFYLVLLRAAVLLILLRPDRVPHFTTVVDYYPLAGFLIRFSVVYPGGIVAKLFNPSRFRATCLSDSLLVYSDFHASYTLPI